MSESALTTNNARILEIGKSIERYDRRAATDLRILLAEIERLNDELRFANSSIKCLEEELFVAQEALDEKMGVNHG